MNPVLPGFGGGQCDRAAPGGGDGEAGDLPAGVRAQPAGAGPGGGRGAGTLLHVKLKYMGYVRGWCGWSQVTQSNNLYRTTTFTILAPTLETTVHCVKGRR